MPLDKLNQKQRAELQAMSQVAEQHALALLDKKGLKSEGGFEYSWNEYFNCQIIKLRIAGEPRCVEIKILNEHSNNNFNSDDVQRLFESKVITAKDFHKHNKPYQDAISAISGRFAKEIAQLRENFYKAKNLNTLLNNVATIHQSYICELAAELARVEHGHGSASYNPTAKQIKAKVKILKKHEIDFISQQPRDISINTYPQTTDYPNRPQWLLNINDPLSYISAAKRNYKEKALSNYWEVTDRIVHLEQDPKEKRALKYLAKRGKAVTFYRSSSVAQLGYEIHDEALKIQIDAELAGLKTKPNADRQQELNARILQIKREQELEGLKAVTIKSAMEQVIAQLITGEKLDPTMLVERCYITLLSPTFISEQFGQQISNALTKKLEGTLVEGNELVQLESMQTVFEGIEDAVMNFSLDDKAEIIRRVLVANPRITPEQLRQLENITAIRNDNSYINFPVNKADIKVKNITVASVPMSVADIYKFNMRYNAAGIKRLQSKIAQHLGKNFGKLELIDVVGLFQIEVSDPDTWKKTKANINQKINKLIKLDPSRYQESDQIRTLYIRIQDYLHKTEASENTRISNGYLVATACVFKLNNLLGVANHITCKSGKDRTGMFAAIVEALLDPDSEHLIIKNICNAIKYSSVKDMNEKNNPGIRGWQIDADILDGMKDLFGEEIEQWPQAIHKLIEDQMLRNVGALGKEVYRCDAAIQEYVKQYRPTEAPQSSLRQFFGGAVSSATSNMRSLTSPRGKIKKAQQQQITTAIAKKPETGFAWPKLRHVVRHPKPAPALEPDNDRPLTFKQKRDKFEKPPSNGSNSS